MSTNKWVQLSVYEKHRKAIQEFAKRDELKIWQVVGEMIKLYDAKHKETAKDVK